jgi:hypothetical protein
VPRALVPGDDRQLGGSEGSAKLSAQRMLFHETASVSGGRKAKVAYRPQRA